MKLEFLNGMLEEDIYVEKANGFITGQEQKVYLLKKAFCRLKQAPKTWYSKMDEHSLNLGSIKSLRECTLFVKKSCFEIVIVSLYVDDLLVTRSDDVQIEVFKHEMMKVFKMTCLGLMHYFLGTKI